MIISIIGSGAVGKIYGGLLAQAGHEVHFLVHSEYEALKSAGSYQIRVKDTDQSVTVSPLLLHTTGADLLPPIL
ncbi:MAG TPA: 2-dehydropantoate 2-reductase N-terminal domain-containing protein [Gammaproteobacteria bacterium]|nr:2-dehydropantoate 2-reductase N-terminal domain-containing protein [Gammaproteobacteria bacterium]